MSNGRRHSVNVTQGDTLAMQQTFCLHLCKTKSWYDSHKKWPGSECI